MTALSGLRVVELGPRSAAARVGALLAEQGADVVRVLPPDPPRERPSDRLWARGKRTTTLDLRRPDDQDHLAALLARADVLLDGLRPDARARRGLGDERLRRDNPGLVVVCLPGFGRRDARRRLPGWEALVAAAAGVHESPVARQPTWVPVDVATGIAAAYGAVGVLAGLIARDRDGLGQLVEVPLFDAALAAQELAAVLTHKPPRAWTSLAWAASPLMDPYRCADGRWVYLHLGVATHLPRFLRLLDRLDPAEGAAFRATLTEATWAQPSEPGSPREALRLRRRLQALFARKPAEEWEALFGEAGLCAVMCRQGAAWLDHPHAQATGQAVVLEDPERGATRQPGATVRLASSPPTLSPPAPAEQLIDVLEGWAPRPEAARAANRQPPLAGVRVLDLSQVIAGPSLARTLAELGAEVLRVENPGFDGNFVEPFHLAFNTGKRSATLDLSKAEGLAALGDLLERWRPDVLVESYAAGVMDRLGMSEQALRARLPGLVIARVSAWDREGPWGHWKGWEQTAQAVTGAMHRYGGDAPDVVPVPANDLGTGVLGAFGVLLALRRRDQRGAGDTVDASLVRTALFLQGRLLMDGDPGRERPGEGPLARFYRTRDGWLALAGGPRDVEHLGRVIGLEGVADVVPEHREAHLERRLRKERTAAWVDRIEAVAPSSSLGALPRRRLAAALADPRVLSRGRVQRERRPAVGEATTLASPLQLSRTPTRPLPPAPVRGEDTAAVITDFGLALPAPTPGALPAKVPLRDLRWLLRQLRWALYLARTRLLG